MAIKTLHITNSYHPSSGGIRTFYNALLEAANRYKRHVRLVVPDAETSVEEVGEFGRIYRVASPRSAILDTRYRVILPHTYAWPSKSSLRTLFAAEKPDLVEVCDKFWLTYLPGVLRQGWIPDVPVPTLVGLSCERLDDNVAAYLSGSSAAEVACQRYMHWSYVPRFDYHIAVSDYIAGEIRRVLPERMSGRLYVAPMGVDYEFFSRQRNGNELRARLLRQAGGSDESILLAYAGRLSKEKNLLLLPQLLARLGEQSLLDYRLIIAGEGPFAAELRSALESLASGRFLFLGQLNKEGLARLYQAVDVFIHPNPHEPFGIAPLEAMAAGLPLVAPASGGLLTYANRENAWLAQESPEFFATAVQSVTFDPEKQRQKVEKARRTAKELCWERVTADYFQLYDCFFESMRRSSPRDVAHLSRPANGPMADSHALPVRSQSA